MSTQRWRALCPLTDTASLTLTLQLQPCTSSRVLLADCSLLTLSLSQYALGAVASFMHTKIGGISPLAPGWKRILIAPQPQPGSPITNAKVSHLSPYGLISCEWTLSGEDLKVDVVVPPNSTAQVVLPGVDDEVGSGRKTFYVVLKATKGREWPPKSIEGFCEHLPEDEID